MNLQEINQQLSTLLADTSHNYFTRDERLLAINQACNYINSELRLIRKVAHITVTPLDESVPLPKDFVSLGKGIDWQPREGHAMRLNMKSPHQKVAGWASDNQGVPTEYVMEGANLYLSPHPKEVGTVILPYVGMPNVLKADTDIPFNGDPRSQAYHDIIAFHAAWQLTLKDRDFEAAQVFMQYVQVRMVDLKENLRHTGDLVQPVWEDIYYT